MQTLNDLVEEPFENIVRKRVTAVNHHFFSPKDFLQYERHAMFRVF